MHLHHTTGDDETHVQPAINQRSVLLNRQFAGQRQEPWTTLTHTASNTKFIHDATITLAVHVPTCRNPIYARSKDLGVLIE